MVDHAFSNSLVEIKNTLDNHNMMVSSTRRFLSDTNENLFWLENLVNGKKTGNFPLKVGSSGVSLQTALHI